MTKKEMVIILKALKEAYKDFQVTEEKTNLWFELLGDIDFQVAKIAVSKLILENTFSPAIAEIRKQAVEVSRPYTLSAAEALGEVRKAIIEFGHVRPTEALESMSPLTREAVQYIGWSNICLSEEPGVERGQFLRIYEQLRKREEDQALLPESLKEQIKALSERKAVKALKES